MSAQYSLASVTLSQYLRIDFNVAISDQNVVLFFGFNAYTYRVFQKTLLKEMSDLLTLKMLPLL